MEGHPITRGRLRPEIRIPTDEYMSRAAYYALILRQEGKDPQTAAAMVAEAYPALRPHLEQMIRSTPDEKKEPA